MEVAEAIVVAARRTDRRVSGCIFCCCMVRCLCVSKGGFVDVGNAMLLGV